MDKFCNICGNVIPQDSNVCPVCGTPVQSDQPKKNKSKLPLIIGIIALVLVICAVSFVAYTLLTGDDDKDSDSGSSLNSSQTKEAQKVLEEYYVAFMDESDMDTYMKYTHPVELEAVCDAQGITTSEYKESIEYLMESFEMAKDEGVTIDREITVNKNFDDDDRDKLIEKYEDKYGLEVEAVESFKAEYTVNNNGNAITQSETANVVKIDGEWYVGLKI